jgi:hypothetical protein
MITLREQGSSLHAEGLNGFEVDTILNIGNQQQSYMKTLT